MLTMFCFDGLAVIVEGLSFAAPKPTPGQDGPERGVRVELRLLRPRPRRGPADAARRDAVDSQGVVVGETVFWVDLLASAAGGSGRMRQRLTADPVGWLEARLADPMTLLAAAGLPDLHRFQPAADGLRDTLPDITRTVTTMLARVRAGERILSPRRAA